MVRRNRTQLASAIVGLVVAVVLALPGCSRSAIPPEPPLPEPPGASVLGCEDRLPVPSGGEAGDADVEVADVVFWGLTVAAERPSTNVPTDDPETYAAFAKAPISVPSGIDWVSIEVIGTGTAGAWMPATVWTGRGWVIDDYASRDLVLDLRACSTPGGLRDGSYFLGGIATDGARCVDLRVATSASPEPQERTVAIGEVTC